MKESLFLGIQIFSGRPGDCELSIFWGAQGTEVGGGGIFCFLVVGVWELRLDVLEGVESGEGRGGEGSGCWICMRF